MRYLLFLGSDYYPEGGCMDMVGRFDNLEDINSFMKKAIICKGYFGNYLFENGGWANYYDTIEDRHFHISRDINLNWIEIKMDNKI